jgi:hypothetical protein
MIARLLLRAGWAAGLPLSWRVWLLRRAARGAALRMTRRPRRRRAF